MVSVRDSQSVPMKGELRGERAMCVGKAQGSRGLIFFLKCLRRTSKLA